MEDFDFYNSMENLEPLDNLEPSSTLSPINTVPNPTVINGFELKSISYDPNEWGGVTVTDMFGGKHHYSSMEQAMSSTDILSGLPSSCFTPMPTINLNAPSEIISPERALLNKAEEIEAARNNAVNEYNQAKLAGNMDEMAKWEKEARDKEREHRDLFNAPNYSGLPPRVEGIDY